MKLVVMGAGAWGTALAISAAQRHRVTLWARDPAQASAMAHSRSNERYLSGRPFPPLLSISSGPLDAHLAACDLLVVATPVAALRESLMALQTWAGQMPLSWVCKGFDSGADSLLPHEVAQSVVPGWGVGVLSGPSFAAEVAAGKPTALVASSADAAVQEALAAAFHSPTLRVYRNDDMVGVEVGGAVKNVLAIATGLCDGMLLGLNARAALITRGLAEITRLGVALGARADTFMGLSGLGDLVLTATGDLSRNRRVGLGLAQGRTLAAVLHELGHVAEGVACAHAVLRRAQGLGVDMPITQAVVELLEGRIQASQAVAALMGRDARNES